MTNHPNRSKVKDWPEYVKRFREKHKLTQVSLASSLKVEETTVQRWERGDRMPPQYLRRALRDLERELAITTKQ